MTLAQTSQHCFRSLAFLVICLFTALLRRYCHSISIRLRSGPRPGRFTALILLFIHFSHSGVDMLMCFGIIVLLHDPNLIYGTDMASHLLLDHSGIQRSSWPMAKCPGLAAKRPLISTPPPPCLTVGVSAEVLFVCSWSLDGCSEPVSINLITCFHVLFGQKRLSSNKLHWSTFYCQGQCLLMTTSAIKRDKEKINDFRDKTKNP